MRSSHPFEILSGAVLLSTAALLSTAVLGSTAALAADPTAPPSLTVSYVQADLQGPAATEKLYNRIQRAARNVCQEPMLREVDRYHLYKNCYERAMDNAVANVGATALTE